MNRYDYTTYSKNILSKKDISQNLYNECSGYYDKNYDKYVRKDPFEIFECCINNCDEYLKYCKSICKNQKDCDKCYRYFEDCQEGCKTGDFWKDNYFNNCYRDTVCFNNYVSDIDCIKEKKNELINCCKSNCNNSIYKNCGEYCNYMYDFIVDDIDNKNLSKWQNLQSSKNYNTNTSNKDCNNNKYIKYFFIVCLILVFITISLSLKNDFSNI